MKPWELPGLGHTSDCLIWNYWLDASLIAEGEARAELSRRNGNQQRG